MTVLERKTLLKHKIDSVTDENILDELEDFFDDKRIYKLTEEQLQRVEEARAEYLRGETISDEEDQKYFEEWFAEQEKLNGR